MQHERWWELVEWEAGMGAPINLGFKTCDCKLDAFVSGGELSWYDSIHLGGLTGRPEEVLFRGELTEYWPDI